jgi:hypothetical protein
MTTRVRLSDLRAFIYLSDAEIARLIPMKPDEWKAAARALERYGLPRPDPLFNNRRCWPKVYEFLCGGTNAGAPSPASGVFLPGEVPHGFRTTGRRGRKADAP